MINLDENVGRVVGRRKQSYGTLEARLRLQGTMVQMHKAFGHRWPVRGVFRFKTHEEADQWMMKLMARSGLKKR